MTRSLPWAIAALLAVSFPEVVGERFDGKLTPRLRAPSLVGVSSRVEGECNHRTLPVEPSRRGPQGPDRDWKICHVFANMNAATSKPPAREYVQIRLRVVFVVVD